MCVVAEEVSNMCDKLNLITLDRYDADERMWHMGFEVDLHGWFYENNLRM